MRRLIRALVAGLLGIGAIGCGPPPPDVVIVLVDTLRADYTALGKSGQETESTPFLRELAEHAVVFEDATSPAPWTLPSVASLFTGQHLAQHGVIHDRQMLPAEATTLAERLRDHGYETASFYRNPFAGAEWGLDQGFETPVLRPVQTGGVHLEAFFEGLTDAPLLLYVHNTEPHDPFAARLRFRRRFDPDFVQEYGERVSTFRRLTRVDYTARRPLGTRDNTPEQLAILDWLLARRGEARALYAGAVRDADERLASIVETVKARGRWDRTLFVLLSDHGEELGERGGWQHDQSVYQELVHVPLLIRFPGDRFAGRRIASPVSTLDVLPTVLDVAGLPGDEALAGRSLLPLLEAAAPPPAAPRLVAIRDNRKKYTRPWFERRGNVNLVVREGPWKAIVNVERDTVELYDLARDPEEREDRAAAEPERARRLAAFGVDRYAALRPSTAPSGAATVSDEVRRALVELGYVSEDEPGEAEPAPPPRD